MLIKGRIIPQNLNRAKKIADKKLRDYESEYLMILGKIEMKKKKYDESTKHLLKSIEGGNVESMYIYGKMLNKGEELSVNKENALKYFKRAIDKGHSKSMLLYGQLIKKFNFNSFLQKKMIFIVYLNYH